MTPGEKTSAEFAFCPSHSPGLQTALSDHGSRFRADCSSAADMCEGEPGNRQKNNVVAKGRSSEPIIGVNDKVTPAQPPCAGGTGQRVILNSNRCSIYCSICSLQENTAIEKTEQTLQPPAAPALRRHSLSSEEMNFS